MAIELRESVVLHTSYLTTVVNRMQFVCYYSFVRRRDHHFPGWDRVPDRLQDTAQASE